MGHCYQTNEWARKHMTQPKHGHVSASSLPSLPSPKSELSTTQTKSSPMAPLLSQTHTAARIFSPIPCGSRRLAPSPHAVGFLRTLFPPRPPPAKANLLRLIADQGRGLETQSDPSRLADIVSCIDALAASAPDVDTVSDADKLSGTWRLLWTTEQEQLFIVRNAPTFRTAAGDVLQVIDVAGESLNNVITFPPSGAFIVNGTIEIQPPQRVNFKFTRAMLKGGNWEVPFPPFGKGWFDTVYLDDEIRVAKDIRGDYLVVERAPYSWNG